jgi:uncharacterized membrane protein
MMQSKQRYLFIDLLRFVAGIFMIQGHVFDALLSPQVKSASWYYVHDFFHGFIAPMFLFASGVAFGVATIRSWDQHIVPGDRVRRRIWKFIALIAIGYALHLPYFSLRKTIDAATFLETKAMVQVDALQCIGVTLLILQGAVFLLRRKETFIRWVAIGGAVVIFGSPIVWSLRFAGRLPLWMAAYLNAENGSWFPLFPWSAYILCGVLFGYFFLKAGSYREEVATVLKYVAASAGLAVLAVLALRLPFDVYPSHDYWKSNPSIILVRLCVVSVVASGIFLIERFIQPFARIPSIMGKESLFVYIVHLLIVYGSVMGPGLNVYIGPTLSVVEALQITILVCVVVMFLAVLWYGFNSNHRSVADRLKLAGAATFLMTFLLRKW